MRLRWFAFHWHHLKLNLNSKKHWGLNKMVDILQAFCNVISGMKVIVFWFKFHWSLFLRVQLIPVMTWYRKCGINNISWGNGLLPDGTKPLPQPTLTQASVRCAACGCGKILLQQMGWLRCTVVAALFPREHIISCIIWWECGEPHVVTVGPAALLDMPLATSHVITPTEMLPTYQSKM